MLPVCKLDVDRSAYVQKQVIEECSQCTYNHVTKKKLTFDEK